MPSEFDISEDPELANLVGPPLGLQRSTHFSEEELEDMGTFQSPPNRAILPDRLRPIGEMPSASNEEPSVGNEEMPSVSKPYSNKRGKNGGKKSRTRRNKKRQIRRKTNKRYSRRR